MDASIISMEMLTILLAAIGLAGLILTSQSRLEGRLTKQNRDLEERLTKQIQEVRGQIEEMREDVANLSRKVDGLTERVAWMEGKFEIFEKFLRWNGLGAPWKEGD